MPAGFRIGPTSRAPIEILAHVNDLLDWADSLVRGAETSVRSNPRRGASSSEGDSGMLGLRASLIALALAASARATPLPTADDAAVRASLQAYRDAWLKGDAGGVLATFVPGAILLPSGRPPIEGQIAMRAFWWPAQGPATRILTMEQEVSEVSGADHFAVARGTGSLAFAWVQDGVEKQATSRFTFLNVLAKGDDGTWKTTHRMWSDLPKP